ncbi:MAG: glycosyltransferase family 4 protein, partial [Candidatus Taylorbacteria bacterium]|nr:glycosyltransferase family 4 protein [Candidatus Taylorbacteria bacterium]
TLMKIGFYFEASKKSGGAYQYALNLAEALRENRECQFIVFNLSADFPFSDFKLPNWKIINLVSIEKVGTINREGVVKKEPLRRKLVNATLSTLRRFHLYKLEIYLTRQTAKRRAAQFKKQGVDLMFFHGPSELSFLTSIPSIVPIHDLEHRRHDTFPELRTQGQWQKREYLYNNIKKIAYKILTDSTIGKQDVVDFYNVPSERIEIVPFLPPSYLTRNVSNTDKQRVLLENKLPEKFIFYPAQFWPHKNHENLVLAIALLKKRGVIVPTVLVGSKLEQWGAYQKTLNLIKENQLEQIVHFLGYVSNDEMSVLYATARALVMPTFLGPTNIPVYEAWMMGCPVLYSDIRGPREQAGDAALLFDPYSPESIAKGIEEIWNNDSLRLELIEKGTARLELWTRQNFYDKIREIVNEFKISHEK